MKSTWTGAISLSKLQIPVKLGSTVKESSLGLRMVRKSDGSQVKFQRVAEADGKEVEWNDIAKGYDAPDGSLVILDNEDFEQAYGDKNRTAAILLFTDPASIPPVASKTSYYVQPNKGGDGAYALLADALEESGKVAIIKFAMRQRESLAVLRAHDGYLIMESLEWHSDILVPDFAAPRNSATEDEKAMALKLISAMSGEFDHASYTDKSSEALAAIIQAKMERKETIAPPAKPEGADGSVALADLMSALNASIEDYKSGDEPRPARKRTTRKASA